MDDMPTPRDDSCLPETPGYSESLVMESDQTRYPAVSVGFPPSLTKLAGVPTVNDFPYSLQPSSLYDDKAHDIYFDFDQFPDPSESSLAEASQAFFNSSFITHDSVTNPYGLSDPNDAKLFDMQTDSGATAFVSDETCLAAEG
jgi:transcriptional activator HAC1